MPTAELIVMYDLLDHGPSTITELAERTGYAQSRVSSAVVGLCERHWVQTRSDPADGRRTIVHVPAEAQCQARLVQARNANEEVLQPLLAELPARRREAIIRALTDLHNLYATTTTTPAPPATPHKKSTNCSHPTTALTTQRRTSRRRR